MQESIGKKVHPGIKIARHQEEQLGYGLYSRDSSVYASVFGRVAKAAGGSYCVQNNLSTKKVGLQVGDIVLGRVIKVKEEECTLQILQVNDICCLAKGNSKSLEGTIRKENVRQKMVDSVVMIDSFRPRDIVRSKVISLGDSVRSIYLSTASENLGVLVAQHGETGRLMLPFDWTSMIEPEEVLKEPRKVCNPREVTPNSQ